MIVHYTKRKTHSDNEMKTSIPTWKLMKRKMMTAKIHVSFVTLCHVFYTIIMVGKCYINH